ncbi:MAG TPA: DNA-3-methyladenine glycosylase [Microbacteriaceae bacterium]|nr:DNA-3-methyladenine glycosylase [Microbacteriaceae bacterium]
MGPDFAGHALEVAPRLLGAVLRVRGVAVRLTEVEAYGGPGEDPGSHTFRGLGRKNATMFGPPGHLYVYFTYGMHWCANVVCSPEGDASGVLLRGGEVIEGIELARQRRASAKRDAELARGPARLTVALDITGADDGAVLGAGEHSLELLETPLTAFSTGPRTGVSGPGGDATAFPWRFWLPGEPSVSPYRPHVPKRRR